MIKRPSQTIIFQAGPLTSASYVMAALAQMTADFEEMGLHMPPLPPSPAGLAPCHIEVIEFEDADPRDGMIRFHRDGKNLFMAGWDPVP
jgi:hypothetical protein